jgi:hypothetical protein
MVAMQRAWRVWTVVGLALVAAGVLLGTRPMSRRADHIGFRCSTYFWPRCHTYQWPSVVAVALTSGGVGVIAAMAACSISRRRERSRTPIDSIGPSRALSTTSALILVAVPLFVAGLLAGAAYFNLVLKHIPAGD